MRSQQLLISNRDFEDPQVRAIPLSSKKIFDLQITPAKAAGRPTRVGNNSRLHSSFADAFPLIQNALFCTFGSVACPFRG